MSYHTPLDTNMLTLKNQTRAERKRAAREQEKDPFGFDMPDTSILTK